MFAHAGEANVTNQNHFVIVFRERDFQMPRRIESQASEHFLVHVRDAARGFFEAVTVGIFSDRFKDQANCILELWNVNFGIKLFVFHNGFVRAGVGDWAASCCCCGEAAEITVIGKG